MNIVFSGCNCTSGELDVYLDIAGTEAFSSTPVQLSYDGITTGYIEVPAAAYTLSVTEAGNNSNLRIGPVDLNLVGGSVTTYVVKDQPGGPLGTAAKIITVNDLQQ